MATAKEVAKSPELGAAPMDSFFTWRIANRALLPMAPDPGPYRRDEP